MGRERGLKPHKFGLLKNLGQSLKFRQTLFSPDARFFLAKMHQIQFQLGLCPRPCWELTAVP